MTGWSRSQKWEIKIAQGVTFAITFGTRAVKTEKKIWKTGLTWENESGWRSYFMAGFSFTGCRFSGYASGVLV
jgi:hypothetical protein